MYVFLCVSCSVHMSVCVCPQARVLVYMIMVTSVNYTFKE